jgi:integrase/recombinase XerD
MSNEKSAINAINEFFLQAHDELNADDINIKVLYKLFISSKKGNFVRQGTIDFYEKQWKKVNEFFRQNRIERVMQIDPVVMSQLSDYCFNLGNSANTARKALEFVRTMINFAYLELKKISRSPIIGYRMPKKEAKEIYPVEDKNAFKILNYLMYETEDNEISARYRLIFYLLSTNGPRYSELFRIQKRNINFEKNTILLTHTKSSKQRSLYLDEFATKLLKDYLKYVNHDYIFTNPKTGNIYSRQNLHNYMTSLKKQLGIPHNEPVNPHAWRHYYCKTLVKKGVNMKHIQSFMGHSTMNTTQRYANFQTSELSDIHKSVDLNPLKKSE